ncbi:MAG TPA: biosynthetic peptidoglycan transglycosylase [Syntrophomonadaceae bacterium]|nr:biosynthetic peptidoglycan transglycosylase [Syntrophomonadaceae bacterium]
MRKRYFKTAVSLLLLLSLVLISAYYAWLPNISALPVLVKSQVTSHNTSYVPLSQVPPFLQKALVDTEDQSFYINPGISFKGIARSVIADLISGKYKEGASTLTQQLVRQYYLSQEKTISRKLKEAYLAVLVTKKFSKETILEMYLNSVYFGHGAWGIDAAARIYFSKSVGELNVSECTLLAGLPQAPSYLDPYINYQAARNRQLEVLYAMADAHDLNQKDIDKIMAMPLVIK